MEKLLGQVQEALESPDGFDNLDEVIEKSINTDKGDLISTIVFERGFCDVTRRLNNLSENLITICSSDQSFDIPTFNKLLLTNINNIFSSSCSSLTDMKHLHLTADRTKKLYIVIKQTESFPSTTIDKIITTLYELKLPVILICCVSTNRDSLFLKCSRSNYLLLDIKYASVNSPEVIFDKIWSKIQLNKDIPFIFSNEIIDKARESYFNYSYSIKDIQKYLELSIAFHFNKINNGHVIIDKSNDFSSYKDAFVDTLLLLHDMTRGYYSQKSIWYLYSMIYSNDGNIFDNTDGTEFFRWLSVWNVWGREKFIECLENIEVIINEGDCEFLKCLCDDLKMLLERLNTLDKRIEEETKNQQTKLNNIGNVEVKKVNNKNKIRINKDERQRILRDKMEYKKNCDLFSKDKKDIFEFLSRFFKMTFSHMYSVKGFSYYFIENVSFIQRLIDPPSDYYIDIDLNHLLNNSDQYFNLNTNDKLDVPLSYKLLQSLTNIHTTKPISIEKWKQAFINDCSSDERIDVRFRKTLKVLKQLRVIKDASENNVEKIIFIMSKVFEPVKRQDSTDSEVEIVDPEECTDNGAKNEKKSDLDEKSKAESEHDTENDTDNDNCQEDEDDVEEEGESEDETEEDKWYGSDSRRKALNNLLYYSVLMFVLPLLTMYISYQFIFIDYFHYDTDTAAMYSGLVAACVVYIVIISFIWEAYNEEKEAENRKKTLKSE